MNNWEERLEEKSIDSSALFFQMYHKRVITLEDAEQFISQLLKEQSINELEFALRDAKERGTDLRLTIKSRLNLLKEQLITPETSGEVK